MISEAYDLFGCNSEDIYIVGVNYMDNNAACIQFDLTYGIEFTTISGVEGGGAAINSTYGIPAYPTYILIAPDHSIVEQDMWPIPNTQTFVTYFQSNGIQQAECPTSTLSATFASDVSEICTGESIQFEDLSTGDPTGWEWTFEGGTPATSTEQNPLVTYNTAGSFDVTLTITDGIGTDSFTVENYITVYDLPAVTLDPFGTVNLDDEPFALTGGMPAGGDYSGPGVSNNMFDPAVAGVGIHTITYTYSDNNGCENYAEETIEVINSGGEYCIPSANCSYGDGFTDFGFAGIENWESGCSPNGYGDFTA
nr:PKD domain-containing protein [Bacteroidota bacterium]